MTTCPLCHCKTRVYGTDGDTNLIIRYRRCESCGHKFRTYQKPEEIISTTSPHAECESVQKL